MSFLQKRQACRGVVSMGASVCPVHPDAPIHLYTPIPPVHLYVSPIPYVPICHRDLGASVHPICLGVFWGDISTSVRHSVSVGTSTCLSVHNSHTSCSPSLSVASLLDWMPMDVYCASCCCPFFVVFSLCLTFLLPWL